MDTNVKWSAEQIQIPNDLSGILKEYTKDVLKANLQEDEIIDWSIEWFKNKRDQ